MARYTVEAPDGHLVTLEGPAGASHDEVIAMAQQLYHPGAGGPQPPAAPRPHRAIAGEPDLGDAGNAALAGGIGFVHNLPLVGDAAITAGRWANDHLNGRDTSWQQANDEAHQTIESAQNLHPVASTVGAIGGAVDTGVLAGGLGRAAGIVRGPGALPQATTLAEHAANAGRLALAGGVGGAAYGAAQSGGEKLAGGHVAEAPKAALRGGVQGGVAGAVLGPIASGGAVVAKQIGASLDTKTAMALAKVFGESPSDLQAAWATFKLNTGRVPTMAELTAMKQQGQLAGAARDSTTISVALRQAADDAGRARSENMQDVIAQTQSRTTVGPPAAQSSGQVGNATTAAGDIDFAAARAHNFSIPTEESAELGGVSPADHLASEVVSLAGLKTADRVRIQTALQSGTLSGQDAQLMRSKLAAAQGQGSSYSPAIASALEDLDHILGSPGNEAATAALGIANANYTAGAQRAAGAAHGESILGAQTADNYAAEAASKPNANPNFQAGMPSGARSVMTDEASTPPGALGLARRFATDDGLRAKLATTFGVDAAEALRRLGTSESAAADNLAPYARRTPPADDQDVADVKTVLTAAASIHSPIGGPVYKTVHLLKMGLGLGMSPKVQEKVAEYLTNPKMVPQAINLLRKAGATNAQLRQLAFEAAQSFGVAGAGAVDSVLEPQQ